MAIVNIFGVQLVLGNMVRSQSEVTAGAVAGLKRAALLLQRDSQSHVPVEYGPLRASAYTRVTGQGLDTVVDVGYTAAYALYVHEQVAMRLRGQPRPSGHGAFWDPQGQAQAKFLEEPLRRLRPQMSDIIFQSAKIKP
jgi:hypothetical protein